ncbi:IS1595 family transposase [Virgibacillus sp. C22-A2]|uniref:IS1595 family transposase n=1 Tax=Virgibacillus tibetensis TaxID=3042313 RepID=A0ABU6KIG6_9BACI|nr:IS1595 family transposase [Virgibacillus sp. C22-A2]
MEVVPSLKRKTLIDFAKRQSHLGSIISSDVYRSYRKLEDKGYKHESQLYNPKKSPDHLHWLDTVLSNAKALVGGIFHWLSSRHLQSYLDEFCYRFNRRKHEGDLFSRLPHHCIGVKTITHRKLVEACMQSQELFV